MNKLAVIIVVLIALAGVSGCSSSSSPSADPDDPLRQPLGTFRVTIDGFPYTPPADLSVIAKYTDAEKKNISILAEEQSTQLLFSINLIDVGPFQGAILGPAEESEILYRDANGRTYDTQRVGAKGSVSLASTIGDKLAGTFEATVMRRDNSGEKVELMVGVFNLEIEE